MSETFFFAPKGPFYLKDLFKDKSTHSSKLKISDIKTLDKATRKDITFFNSVDYSSYAKKTKAAACLTTKNLERYLPDHCIKILVNNVLFSTAKISIIFYPDADLDYPDKSLVDSKKISSKYPSVTFGKNIFIGKKVKIGSKTSMGTNNVIEHDVQIGKNCLIGSNVTIKNSVIGDNVVIQDGCKIGVKGFGFIPLKNKNFRFPHIGRVILKDNVELGANCTIDRGSIGDTIIGEYLAFALFLDFFATVMAVVSYNINVRSSRLPKQSQAMMNTCDGDDHDLKSHVPKDVSQFYVW